MPPQTDNLRLEELYQDDQKDRSGVYADAASVDQLREKDRKRREEVLRMMSQGEVLTGKDLYHAGIIMLHGDNLQDFLTAHRLAVISAVMGLRPSRWLAAASLDRYLMALGQPQVYGTQFEHNPEDNRYQLRLPIEDSRIMGFEKKFFDVPLVGERLAQLNGRLEK
mgnify:CR=1 FL=1